MKNIILIFLLVVTSFSYELNFNKTFYTDTSLDIIKGFVSISSQGTDEAIITDNLEEFKTFIEQDKSIFKQNGSFRLNPKYKYINNQQVFMGYTGVLSYTIISNNGIDFNNFILTLIDFKNSYTNQNIHLSIGNSSWKLSPEKQDIILDKLRLKAIRWIENYSKQLSKTCSIKQINIGKENLNKHNSFPILRSTAKNIIPNKGTKRIKLDASYTLECK